MNETHQGVICNTTLGSIYCNLSCSPSPYLTLRSAGRHETRLSTESRDVARLRKSSLLSLLNSFKIPPILMNQPQPASRSPLLFHLLLEFNLNVQKLQLCSFYTISEATSELYVYILLYWIIEDPCQIEVHQILWFWLDLDQAEQLGCFPFHSPFSKNWCLPFSKNEVVFHFQILR